jgi:two-component system cell cycle response regulator CpdR
VSALTDPEDSPPFERSEFREADTDPPHRGAPVHVFRDDDRPTDSDELRGQSFEREERTSLLSAMADLRAEMVTDRKQLRSILGWCERIGYELGGIKTHLTSQSLRVANLEGVEPNGLRDKRVLVVEDDPVLLKLIVRVLSDLGCRVDGAGNREDAERLIAKTKYDATLIDLRIPSSDDGIQLCRWVSRMWPSTAIVVMSGHLDAPGLDSLCAARIEKPFELEHLQYVLSQATGHGAALADTIPPPPPPFPVAEVVTRPSPPVPSTARETPDAKRE